MARASWTYALKGHLANTIFFEFALARFNCDLASSPHRAEPTWRQRPRPPARGGFADLGCGNGLTSSRRRAMQGTGSTCAHTSWAHYPPTTTTLLPASSFLTGNHTDEPTPWGSLTHDARPRIQVPLDSMLCVGTRRAARRCARRPLMRGRFRGAQPRRRQRGRWGGHGEFVCVVQGMAVERAL